MKSKRIAVVHTGLFSTLASVESMFNKIIKDLEHEGRELRYANADTAVFEDGSKVFKLKVLSLAGRRVTHLFIDSSFYDLKNGEQVIKEALLPCVISKGDYDNFDASSDAKERVFLFDNEGNIKKL